MLYGNSDPSSGVLFPGAGISIKLKLVTPGQEGTTLININERAEYSGGPGLLIPLMRK